MDYLCMLITKPPHSDEGAERMCGISNAARDRGMGVAVYLIGDGVLCAKRHQHGYVGAHIKRALERSMSVYASAQDLRARGIAETQVEKGIVITEDIEGRFLKDAMERASRVISW